MGYVGLLTVFVWQGSWVCGECSEDFCRLRNEASGVVLHMVKRNMQVSGRQEDMLADKDWRTDRDRQTTIHHHGGGGVGERVALTGTGATMKAASLYVSSGVSEDMRREGVAAERRTEEHAAADCSRPALLGIFTMEWPPVLKAEVPAARQTRRNALDIILT